MKRAQWERVPFPLLSKHRREDEEMERAGRCLAWNIGQLTVRETLQQKAQFT